jgi:hypothetical protein
MLIVFICAKQLHHYYIECIVFYSFNIALCYINNISRVYSSPTQQANGKTTMKG